MLLAATARVLDDSDEVTLLQAGVRHLRGAMEARALIDQAQGMVAVQLGVDLHEAMIRIRAYAYAYAHGCSLSDVADDIIARRLALETDS